MIDIPQLYQLFLQSTGVTTDSRKVQAGQLYIALKGPNFNGNLFAAQAIEAGAVAAVVDEARYANPDQHIWLVEDTLQTLQQLALYHRRQFQVPVLAITGSNGKTTTKELIHAVLSKKYRTYTTQGNLNNHIGVPLTLLSVKPDAEMMVIEMGANHQQEIASYCRYTEPTHGLITNVGKAHLEGFGGEEGVKKGKGELFDFLRAHNGEVFACADFDYFRDMSKGINQLHWYGTAPGTAVAGTVVASEPFLTVQMHSGMQGHIQTQLVGGYNVYNVLAAVAVGLHFGVASADIQKAIEAYTPTNSRSQLLENGGNKYILDAYNANPSSMVLAIENFAKLHAANKVLFIGAMAELGDTSLEEHAEIVRQLQRYEWKEVVLVGGDFGRIVHPFRHFDTSALAGEWWQQQGWTNCYVLVKGSRSTRMEQVLPTSVQK